MQREREALVVVTVLPLLQGGFGVAAICERLTVPKLFAVDAMAPLDLAVLLRPAGFDVPVPHAGRFDGQAERQRKFGPVIALNLLNGERERVRDFTQEVETGVVILTRVPGQSTGQGRA